MTRDGGKKQLKGNNYFNNLAYSLHGIGSKLFIDFLMIMNLLLQLNLSDLMMVVGN